MSILYHYLAYASSFISVIDKSGAGGYLLHEEKTVAGSFFEYSRYPSNKFKQSKNPI